MSQKLILRANTRYECHGDGTCCTDIHLLGPLSKREAKRVRSFAQEFLQLSPSEAVYYHEGIEDLVFASQNGRCVFLDDDARCKLHATVGFDDKPNVCRHFPVGATATERGLRVTLSHRCPCVSVGDSRPLDEMRARTILQRPRSGRIVPDFEVSSRIRWRKKNYVSLAKYEKWEAWLIAQLERDRGESIETLLSLRRDKLPKLERSSWKRLGKRLWKWTVGESETDGYFNTVRWTAIAMRDELEERPSPARPWLWTFDRTAARCPDPTPTRRIYGRWLADWLWSLGWALSESAYRAGADMGARYVLARRLAANFERLGAREDLAAAEAVMIVDTACASEPWRWVQKRLAEPEAGALGTPGHPERRTSKR